MSIKFDESTTYYTAPDDASLTLQNGDWCFGVWVRMDSATVDNYQYIISVGGYNATGSYNLMYGETVQQWLLQIKDDSDNVIADIFADASTAYGLDGIDRLLICQRNGSDFEFYTCPFGGTPVLEFSTTPAGFVAINNADGLTIGRRTATAGSRHFGNDASGFFKGDFSLTTEEIAALGGGLKPYQLGKTLDTYLPMDSAESTLIDIIGPNDATLQAGTPTTSENPPELYSFPQYVHTVAAVGGGFQSGWALASRRNGLIGAG